MCNYYSASGSLVKAVTLKFMSGRGSTISSAQERKLEFIFEVKSFKICCLSRANHENQDLSIHSNSHLLTLKAQITKSGMLLSSAVIIEASSTNSVDSDQTAPVRAV